MQPFLEIQYHEVLKARAVLLNYCSNLANKDFLAEKSHFGRGSIRNLLVHIGNTYEFWLGRQALQKEINIMAYSGITKVKEVEEYFWRIDSLVNEFISYFAADYLRPIQVYLNNQETMASPIKLFTHVITHEFHHKGQVLSLSRHLGYVPIDTDIIR